MVKYEELEELYNQYDNEISPTKRKQILTKIVELDPNDIDSMHRLIDYVPCNQRLESLLKLKDKAKKIVYSIINENDDVYSIHDTRPYMFILNDILLHYEKIKDYENSYSIMIEMLQANKNDSLGIRFHLVAYYIGQNKISELEDFMDACPDQYSIACKFANLYLKEIKKTNKSNFKILFDQIPYLYCLLSKEIDLSINEVKNIINNIRMYKPKGFYECLIFYSLIKTFQTKISKNIMLSLIPKYRLGQKLSIRNRIPSITKYVLYSLLDTNRNDYSIFIQQLSTYDKSEADWLNAKEELENLYIIDINKAKEQEKIYFGEASLALAKMFIKKDVKHLTNLDYLSNWFFYSEN